MINDPDRSKMARRSNYVIGCQVDVKDYSPDVNTLLLLEGICFVRSSTSDQYLQTSLIIDH